jgi:hypothetical protein
MVVPATVRVPLRGVVDPFGAAVYVAAAEPERVAGVTLNQEAVVDVAHEQAAVVVTLMLPAVPPAATEIPLVGTTV